jgi:glutaredoxin
VTLFPARFHGKCPAAVAHFALVVVAALAAMPAAAQYKVVNPDGSVTYTDRPPPPGANARITQMGRSAAAPAPGAEAPALPADLRQVVQRYPVVLYTSADCPSCEGARQFLQRRGVPYSEKTVQSEEDVLALERLVGGRTVPSLGIGAQPLRGFSDASWGEYLDAAGYPRESRLPRGWPAPTVAPLVERSVAAAPRTAPPAPAAAPAPAPAAEQAPAAEPRIRF